MKVFDIFESVVKELHETPDDKQFIADGTIKWGKSDEFNKNQRYYPDSVASPAIVAFNAKSQKGAGTVGQLDHPLGSGGTLLANASHLVTRVWKDEAKTWWANVRIMNTTRGRDLLAVLKTGTKIGASLRGIGEVDKNGKVKPGLQISAIDFVSSPSFGASATVDKKSVFESYVPEEEFNEEDLNEITSAMDQLNDSTVARLQEMLKKDGAGDWTKEELKAFPLYLKMLKDNPAIGTFHEWFREWQERFAHLDPNYKEQLNETLRREANLKEEQRIAGMSYGADRVRIEQRQQAIDEALGGSRHDAKTISRLYAEYVLAGGKLSRAEYIKKFGF